MASATLKLWTIYDHPTDFPGGFVARRFSIEADGLAYPEHLAITTTKIEDIRSIMVGMGLTVLPRQAADDAPIMESWL